MFQTLRRVVISMSCSLLLIVGLASVSLAMNTAFTYQGQLKGTGGVPLTTTCELTFALYDALSGGTQIGTTVTKTDVAVTNGLLTVSVDFGSSAFDGSARWLEISAKCGSDASYTTLSPRQELTPTPYAIHAGSAIFENYSGVVRNTGVHATDDFVFGSAQLANATGTDDNARLFFDKSKGAFRAGRVEGDQWDDASVGMYSFAAGFNTTASSQYATVAGGITNTASGGYATVGGGDDNTANGNYATVGGGDDNTASGHAATISGGFLNTANFNYATISGGTGNTAGYHATVGGGDNNTASGDYATIAGGFLNTASGDDATVTGGSTNTASGDYAAVGGGYDNTAQAHSSFVIGRFNTIEGSPDSWVSTDPLFVVGNGTDTSARANALTLLKNGVMTISGTMYATAFIMTSDRNAKDHFAPVNPQEVLVKVATLPILTWNYKTQAPSIRHIGPMAQDFRAAFGLGENDTTISTVDPDGVALAAIQGLYQLLQERDATIAALQAQQAAQQATIDLLIQRLSALEQAMQPPVAQADIR